MSVMLNRTWNYLSQSLASSPTFGGYPGPRWHLPDGGSDQPADRSGHLPPALAHFLHVLHLAPTQAEEKSWVEGHLREMEARLKEADVKPPNVADALVRALACHLLGYNVDFMKIYALQLAQKGSILEKKMGYLACTLLLTDDEELILLLINTILRDLKSKNVIEVNIALVAAIHLTPKEMSPMLIPILLTKTTHTKDFIRKKALICLQVIMDKCPEMIAQLTPTVQGCLSDPDPGVVAIAVQVLRSTVRSQKSIDPGLIVPLAEILNQILDHKFPKDYLYRGVEAPWVQMDVMSLLVMILERSEWNEAHVRLISRGLLRSLESVSPKETIGQAIIYQCIRTIAVMNTKCDELVEKSLFFINKCLQSKHSNMKYMGLVSLYEFFRHPPPPNLSDLQQDNVLECLKHPDDSVQRQALVFLYELANESNVTAICKTLLEYIKASKDPFQAQQLSRQCVEVAKKWNSANLDWYTGLLLKLLQASQTNREFLVTEIKAILGGLFPDKARNETRLKAGGKLTKVLGSICEQDKPPQMVQELYIWCLVQDFSASNLVDNVEKVCDIGSRALASAPGVVIASLEAIFAVLRTIQPPSRLRDFLTECSKLKGNLEIQDLADEILYFLPHLDLVQGNLANHNPPRDPLDWTLSMADEFVVEVLESDVDCQVYDPRKRIKDLIQAPADSLRLTPYQYIDDSPSKRTTNLSSTKSSEEEKPPKMLWSIHGRSQECELVPATEPSSRIQLVAQTHCEDEDQDLESVAIEAFKGFKHS
eukprot:maker-scaffold175_size286436-snap-gene-1.50 protein:Tk09284 transcript:maker-scaffold175_size286436-snap-gene-1.50-mRNA-1 annotation:"ap-4 complex subunit epsilon-1"